MEFSTKSWCCQVKECCLIDFGLHIYLHLDLVRERLEAHSAAATNQESLGNESCHQFSYPPKSVEAQGTSD